MKRLVLLPLVLLLSLAAFAQKVSVEGTVTDERNEPVIGASVLEQGTSNGVATDPDGRFAIQVARNATLRISYIGYKTKIVKAAPNMKIMLEEEADMLDEVVSIGYGSVKRKDVTTAVSSVSTADLDTRPIVSAVQGMQGKAAGLQISQANGQPGSAPTIRVRGTTSLNGSNNPLYVVDGVPVDNIDYLAAGDIDNIQILKDASSAAIYGSRAANGVVIIGTKQGKAGVAKISLNAHYAFNTVRDNQNPLNARQYLDLIKDMNEKGVLSLKLPDNLVDQTDWKKEVYRTGNVQDYQLSVTNGTDKLRYYLSGGFTGENGVIVSSNFKRYNIRGSIENDISNWLTINASVAYSDYTYKGTGIISGTGSDRGGVIPAILSTPTYGPIWDPEHPGQYYSDFYGVNVDGPLENIARTKDNKNQYNKLLASGKAIVRLLPELTWTSTVSFDRVSSITTNFLDPELTWETTSQTDIGFDLTMLRNRLTFYFDIYYKKTSDMLMSITLPAGSAAARSLTYNGGEIVNKGIELAVSSKNLVGNLKWNTDFNISFNRNKLTRLDLVPVYWGASTNSNVGQSVVRNAVGHPLGSFWGYIADGVDSETGDMIYRDVNEDGIVSASDRTYIGDPNPDFIFGLTNTFSYKGFNLSILLQGSVGNDIYNVSRMDSEGMFDGRNQTTRVLERWRVPGQKTDVPRVGFNQQNSTYYLEDGSYLRVKDITLSYDIPRSILKKMYLTRLMPYISFNNLLTFTNYSGRDPEVNQYGNSGGIQGIDWGTYPLSRSFVLGLKVEF